MMVENEFDDIIDYYKSEEVKFMLQGFLHQVESFFKDNPKLKNIIHSIKYRSKDPEHLRDKLIRKREDGYVITKENLFSEITDLNGIRLLHLYPQQFSFIHDELMKNISDIQDWKLVENPKAYSWDPENKNFYEKMGILPEIKPSLYTSVHYVVTPNNDRRIVTCEIQVRTLFEEIWGEIDHTINYPHQTDSIACKEQIRVLAKLVSTGTRLADSIFRTFDEHTHRK